MASLPVRDDVLMPLMEALVQIGAAAKSRRQAVSAAMVGLQRFVGHRQPSAMNSTSKAGRPPYTGPVFPIEAELVKDASCQSSCSLKVCLALTNSDS